MIRIHKIFPTRAHAEQWVAMYKQEYHPCGYGTTLDIQQCVDGQWRVVGYRYASCD